MSSRVLVIGAGMAGLSAANALQLSGFNPVIVDKSRGVGGRLATRRSEFGSFNHGASTVSAHTPAFKAFLTETDTAQWNVLGEAEGVPSMSALAKPLMGEIHLHLQLGVARLEASGDGVKALFTNGDNEFFDRAVVAIPAPQAIEILCVEGVLDSWASPLLDVETAPCWAGLFAFENPLPILSVPTGIQLQNDDLALGKDTNERWVFHADAQWSKDHLELDKTGVLPLLLDRFFETLQIDPLKPIFAQAHRWRYARVAKALELPFLQSPDGRISVVGDAFSGPDGRLRDAEAAFESGRALALAPAGILN